MLTVNPSMIKFETQDDIIDYVTRGMCPTKKNFQAVMDQVLEPSIGPRDPSTEAVYISETVIPAGDREIVAAVMERVYENRRWNRNVIICTGAVITGVTALMFMRGYMRDKSKERESEALSTDVGMCHFLDSAGPDLD